MNDKLPTANEIIDENLGGLELTMDDDMWKFYKDVIRQTIESHTQAHTEGLRERVKELEENLVYAIRAIKAVNSFGATRTIIDDLEKVLKK